MDKDETIARQQRDILLLLRTMLSDTRWHDTFAQSKIVAQVALRNKELILSPMFNDPVFTAEMRELRAELDVLIKESNDVESKKG